MEINKSFEKIKKSAVTEVSLASVALISCGVYVNEIVQFYTKGKASETVGFISGTIATAYLVGQGERNFGPIQAIKEYTQAKRQQ